MGFGAYMADDGWITEARIRGRVRALPQRLPRRYLRTALAARGFFDGYGEAAPEHFHFLGLGAPVMLPIASLAAQSASRVTFDATSPIKDAAEGTLYVERPAPLKLRIWKIAQRMLREGEGTWNCPCSFCKSFTARHPFELSRAGVNPGTPLTALDLRKNSPLAAAMPLFALGGDMGRAAEHARVGHNHWVLGTVTRSLTRNRNNLAVAVEGRVNRYERHAGTAQYAQAVGLALQVATADGPFWS